MAADHAGGAVIDSVEGTLYHLMGNRIGKQNQKVRTSNLLIHVGTHLGKDLCLAFEFPAYLLVLAHHSVVAADNYYAHL